VDGPVSASPGVRRRPGADPVLSQGRDAARRESSLPSGGRQAAPEEQMAAHGMGQSISLCVDAADEPVLTKFERPVLLKALFGTALLCADGILTPATSVVSAVAGIAVATPKVSNNTVPISIAFLVVLFLFQRWGTRRISHFFSPVMLVWLLLLSGTGIVNILSYPGVFRAVDPSRAIMCESSTLACEITCTDSVCLLSFTTCSLRPEQELRCPVWSHSRSDWI
jgi:hypothetical protein